LNNRRMRRNLLTGLLILAAVTNAPAQRVSIPQSVFYYQPAASVFGSEAAWVNPAGLSRYAASSFQLMSVYEDERLAKSWGFVTNRDRLAMAYRNLHNPDGDDLQEYLFALGMTMGGSTHLGGSYRYFRQGPPDLHKRHLWNVGVMGGRDNLRWAALFENLNRSRNEEGRRTETEMRYSASYRPMGRQLTLSVDMFLSTGTRLSNADYIFHVEFATDNGLYFRGYLDSDRDFQIGMRVNLQKYFVGSQSHFTRSGDHQRTDFYAGGTSVRQRSVIPEPGRRLTVDLAGAVSENPPQPIIGHRRTPFALLITNIYRAAEDPSVDEMLLTLRGLSVGFAQAEELRAALVGFKSRGKAVTCHLSRAGNIAYYVASAADRILMAPVDQLRLTGLRAELTFYAGSLDKLGVKADLMRIGDYKTAEEQYTRREATEENRDQVNRLLDDLYDQLVTAIAAGRTLSADSVKSLIDLGPFSSDEALEYGLVDSLSYRDELDDKILSPLPQVSFSGYMKDTLADDGWPPRPVVALVVADGEIASQSSDPFGRTRGLTPALMDLGFRQALSYPSVAGIVLRINSPGGFAPAGEDIYHIAAKAAERRPLTVSMADVAASGGYYVAMPSQRIFAGPGSITGSIGIFGGKVDLSGLYEKIDLGKELYTRGRYAGMLSTMRPFSEDEREKYYSHMQAFYDHFVELVASNRTLEVDSVQTLAQGKVFTGREALQNGLIDELGGVKQALDHAARQVGAEDYRVAVFPVKRPWFILPGRSLFRTVSRILFDGSDLIDDSLDNLPLLAETGLYARMPYDLHIE